MKLSKRMKKTRNKLSIRMEKPNKCRKVVDQFNKWENSRILKIIHVNIIN